MFCDFRLCLSTVYKLQGNASRLKQALLYNYITTSKNMARGRERSRTPERKRRRSRSRSKERSKLSRYRRSRSRDAKRRSRSRSKERDRRERDHRKGWKSTRHRSRSRSRSKEKAKQEESGLSFDPTNLDKEEEQKKLEMEMQKRRERIERWRAERKRKEQEQLKKEAKEAKEKANASAPTTIKKWSLEDDSEDEDKNDKNDKEDKSDTKEPAEKMETEKPVKEPEEEKPKPEEEEEDPLDEFMKGVQAEVRKINKVDVKKKPGDSKGGSLVIVTGVAKSKANKNKGELIEQNQDGLEYSSEEEQEDLKDTAANIANKQKKELAKIDHNNIMYMTFRKSFYVEVPEIAKMSNDEVEAYRTELEGIRVKGKGCPKPIKTWAQCGVSTKEMNILKKLGFEKPTPIQAQAIPAIMSGRDLIGIAKTGSGKTLAFLLPMFRHILDQPPLEDTDGPIAIIMTPTRELCMQIGKDIKKFSKSLNLRAVCVYGGTGISEQIAELKRGGRSVVCKEVEQNVVILEEDQKFLKLLELLGIYQELGSIIVFVDKQENADILLKDLMKAGYNCLSLHGGIDQFDRDSTIIDFKSGKQLILVVNYDCPNHYEDYVHRCGRTGRAGNKGFAFTFIVPEQARYAGKKVHTGGGFSGKGFKFDESEAAAVNEKKKFQKAALGLADSDDEDLENDIDQQIESMFATKRTVKEIKAPVGLVNPATMSNAAASAVDKLELAKRLASKINLTKTAALDTKFATQQAAESILKGSGPQPAITAKTVAEQLAAKLNTKLNYQPKEEDDRNDEDSEQTFRKYEEELEINDFPQQARWRVTSKISEYSEAGITVRGTYVPTGKNPPEGERKLYLAIESTSDIAVSKAKSEITRLIKEELLKLQTSGHHTNIKSYLKKIAPLLTKLLVTKKY
ncbi:unnamed protein product [Callosobruchus maculatus]|uniref:RNA helicase n=1 Tax=Callosobruchus maculatus TaxID=64391 RepID=A0A653CH67_CALMS|nr:unnamed protein product [Callosobruchus maculatus]